MLKFWSSQKLEFKCVRSKCLAHFYLEYYDLFLGSLNNWLEVIALTSKAQYFHFSFSCLLKEQYLRYVCYQITHTDLRTGNLVWWNRIVVQLCKKNKNRGVSPLNSCIWIIMTWILVFSLDLVMRLYFLQNSHVVKPMAVTPVIHLQFHRFTLWSIMRNWEPM